MMLPRRKQLLADLNERVIGPAEAKVALGHGSAARRSQVADADADLILTSRGD
jgi:hypothetical protein